MKIKRNYGGLLSVTALAVITMLTPLVEPITLANRNQVQTGMTDGLYYIISWIFIPMICYIAGSTVREKQSQGKSLGQMAVALLMGYIFMFELVTIIETIVSGNHYRIYFTNPIGNLWVLLSIVIWIVITSFLQNKNKKVIFVIAILITCIVSSFSFLKGIPILAYAALLFPFYYSGYCDRDAGKTFQTTIKNKAFMCLILVFLCFVMIVCKSHMAVFMAPMLVSTSFISYQECGLSILTGSVMRVVWLIGGFFFIQIFMYLLPNKNTFLSKLGKHSLIILTMSAALFHYLIQCQVGQYNNLVYRYNYYGVCIIGILITVFWALLSFTGIYEKWNQKCDTVLYKISKTALLQNEDHTIVLQGSNRIRLIIAVCVSFFFSFVIFSPYELFIGNDRYLVFSFQDVWPVMLLSGIGMMLVLIGLLYFLKQRQLTFVLTLLFSILIGGYLQGNFWNVGLPTLNGELIDWSKRWNLTAANSLSWIVILAVMFWIGQKHSVLWKRILEYGSYLLMAMQLVALATLIVSADWADKNNSYFKTDKEFVLSNESNVIVFILDYYDNDLLEQIIAEEKAFLKPLEGFTYFPDMVSKYSRTFPSVEYLLTGQDYMYDSPVEEYYRKAFEGNQFWDSIKNLGYQGRVFVSKEFAVGNVDFMKQYIDNAGNDDAGPPKKLIFARMMQMSVYRNMPDALKRYFWFYTDDMNKQLKNGYEMDDIAFFNGLKQSKLSLNNDQPTFLFYHLNGAHSPYHLNKAGNFVVSGTTAKEQGMGALSIVYEYIRQMKELGIYEQSAVIITSDHGTVNTDGARKMDAPTNPILLVKPKGNNLMTELKISNAPVMHSDLFPTILGQMGDAEAEKQSIFSISEQEKRNRYMYRTVSAPDGTIQDDKLERWEIQGEANDFKNWSLKDAIKIKYPYY